MKWLRQRMLGRHVPGTEAVNRDNIAWNMIGSLI